MSLSAQNLSLLYSQLGTMLKAGVPIQRALTTLSIKAPRGMRPAVTALSGHIQNGKPLQEAMASLPQWFSLIDQHIVAVSEQSGSLDTGLASLGSYYDGRARARRHMTGAMIYPALLLMAAILISKVPAYLISQFGEGTYTTFAFLRDTVGLLLGLVIGLFLFSWLSKWLLRNPVTRLSFDRFINRIPVFGSFRESFALYHWLQSIRLMLKAGYGVLQALKFSSATAASPFIAAAYLKMKPRLGGHETVSHSLAATNAFPEVLVQMWATGEESGRMDETLDKLTTTYEERWQENLKHLTAWLPRIVYLMVMIYVAFQILKLAGIYVQQINSMTEPL